MSLKHPFRMCFKVLLYRFQVSFVKNGLLVLASSTSANSLTTFWTRHSTSHPRFEVLPLFGIDMRRLYQQIKQFTDSIIFFIVLILQQVRSMFLDNRKKSTQRLPFLWLCHCPAAANGQKITKMTVLDRKSHDRHSSKPLIYAQVFSNNNRIRN